MAFASLLQLGDASGCVDLLVKTDRAPEAALFARTYAPRRVLFERTVPTELGTTDGNGIRNNSQAPKAVKAWRTELESQKRVRLASSIGDPSESPELFTEGWEDVLAKESNLAKHRSVNGANAGQRLTLLSIQRRPH